MKNSLYLLPILLFFSLFSYGQQGENDPTFNIADSILQNGGPSQSVSSLCLQNDGKILVGGTFEQYNGNIVNRIARIDNLGEIDATFNTGNGFNYSSYCSVNKILECTDGKILIGGLFSTYNSALHNNLIKLNNDGSVDTSFNIGSGPNNEVRNFAEQPDGKIIIIGFFNSFDGISTGNIVRINIDGSLDTTFQTPMTSSVGIAVAIQSDNKILVGGESIMPNGDTTKSISRLLVNGQLDTTFKCNLENQIVLKILPLANNKILIGTDQKGMFRLNDDGTIDSTFSSHLQPPYIDMRRVIDFQINSKNEIVFTGINWEDLTVSMNSVSYARLDSNGYVIPSSIVVSNGLLWGNAIVVTPNDNAIIGSSSTYYVNEPIPYLVSVDTNGMLNPWFNSYNGFNEKVLATYIQPDDKIIVGGEFTKYNQLNTKYLVRLLPDGEIDTTFNFGSQTIIGQIISISMHSNGKIVIGGDIAVNGQYTKIAQLTPDGLLDTLFNSVNFDGIITQVHALPNGQVLVSGDFTYPKRAMARLNADGSIDNTFSLKENGADIFGSISSFDFQSDGKIIAGGNSSFPILSTGYNIYRFDLNGERDLGFMGVSSMIPYHPAYSQIKKIIVQSDDKVIVCGSFTEYSGNVTSGIIRLLPNGAVDFSYTFLPGFTSTASDFTVNDVLKYSDDKIIAVGEFTSYNDTIINRIVKINTDGSVANGFSPNLGANKQIHSISIQSSGKLIIGGEFSYYNGAIRNRIARLHPSPISVEEFSSKPSEFLIYPNPSIDGNIFINTSLNSIYDIQIFDVFGKSALKNNNLKGNSSIDITGLAGGIYFLQFNSKNHSETKKIILSD